MWSRARDVNKLMVIAAQELGGGYAVLEKFSTVFGMSCLSKPAYYEVSKKLQIVHEQTLGQVFGASVAIVKETQLDLNADLAEKDLIDITVSYDMTWHKRGHTSHYGLGAVIDIVTGLAVDAVALSNYCHACAMKKKKMEETSDDFQTWYATHAEKCCVNFTGSSNAMEAEGASILWSRSVQQNQLRYTGFLGDGDAKLPV